MTALPLSAEPDLGSSPSDSGPPDQATVDWFADWFRHIEANISRAIRGKPEVIHLALVALFAEGHLLLEDVPGTGKTSVARSVAASIGSTWQRIQFTPDLLPSDITGVTIWDQQTGSFRFHPGPVFANIVLADEINRASPKTQSALLEVMEEHRVTIDGEPHPVPRPFLVIATQNPVDMDGTYQLPEAQLDRFLIKTSIGYPSLDDEIAILETHRLGSAVDQLEAVLPAEQAPVMTGIATRIHVSPEVQRYVATICQATRTLPSVRLGASPRASLALVRAARAEAASAGRRYVAPEDVKRLAVPVLSHRLLLTPDAEAQGLEPATLVDQVIAATPVPTAPA